MDVDLAWCGIHPGNLVRVEVGLLDAPVAERDVAHRGDAQALHDGTFHLRPDALRIDLRAAIDADVNARDPQAATLPHLDFDDGCRVGDEAPMTGNAKAPAIGQRAPPVRFLCDRLDDAPEAAR